MPKPPLKTGHLAPTVKPTFWTTARMDRNDCDITSLSIFWRARRTPNEVVQRPWAAAACRCGRTRPNRGLADRFRVVTISDAQSPERSLVNAGRQGRSYFLEPRFRGVCLIAGGKGCALQLSRGRTTDMALSMWRLFGPNPEKRQRRSHLSGNLL
jgi:hypothetical protein